MLRRNLLLFQGNLLWSDLWPQVGNQPGVELEPDSSERTWCQLLDRLGAVDLGACIMGTDLLVLIVSWVALVKSSLPDFAFDVDGLETVWQLFDLGLLLTTE